MEPLDIPDVIETAYAAQSGVAELNANNNLVLAIDEEIARMAVPEPSEPRKRTKHKRSRKGTLIFLLIRAHINLILFAAKERGEIIMFEGDEWARIKRVKRRRVYSSDESTIDIATSDGEE